MKEEGKRSKSASPVVMPGTEVKVEKRKPEDDVDVEDLSKRARLAAGVATEEFNASLPQTGPDPAVVDNLAPTPQENDRKNPNTVPHPTSISTAVSSIPPTTGANGVGEPIVKQEMTDGVVSEAPVVPITGEIADADEDEDAVDSSVLVKTEPSSGSD
jgi:hypothetical protein